MLVDCQIILISTNWFKNEKITNLSLVSFLKAVILITAFLLKKHHFPTPIDISFILK